MADARAGARVDPVGTAGLVGFTVSALSPVASVFISGAGLLRIAGTGAAAGVVVGAAVALLAAVLYAEVASHAPHAGGIYPGVRAVLGERAGFVVMGLALLTAPAFLAFSGQGFAAAIAAAVPGVPAGAAAAGAIVLAASLAVLRLRVNLAVTGVLLACELTALVVLGASALAEPARALPEAFAHPVRFSAGAPVPLDAARLVIAAVAGAFACSGALWGTYLGEDAAGTPVAFGRGLALSGLVGAGLVAAPLVLASLAVTGGDLADPEGPLVALIRRAAGPGPTALAGLAIGVAILNNLLSMTVALGRLVAATARERLWPRPVAALLEARSAATGAPAAATVALAAAALPLLLVPNARLLVILSTEMVTPLLVAGTVLAGRRARTGAWAGRAAYRAPLYPALPLLGLAIGAVVLLAEAGDPAVGRPGLATVAVATVLLLLLHRARRRRSSAP